MLAATLAAAGFALFPGGGPTFALDAGKGGGLTRAPAIVVRTTENVTRGSWVWLLNAACAAGVGSIYLLIKQDENEYESAETERTWRSGELLAPVHGAGPPRDGMIRPG